MSELDYSPILDVIKEAASGVVLSTKPFSFCVGKVIAPEPEIKIMVDQKLILGKKQLILTNAVRDYDVKLTTKGDDNSPTPQTTEPVNDGHYTGTATYAGGGADPTAFITHNHAYSGDKWFTVNLKLAVGESVLLFRVDGGQKYIVLDRVNPPKKGAI